MKRDISKKRLLDYPIEQVWQCLTDPKLLSWLGEAEIELKEGGKVTFRENGNEYHGEILTVQKPINLAYSWNDPGHSFTSYVWWKLMDKKGQTLLELEHSGFKGIIGILASYSYKSFWSRKFRNLEKTLKEMVIATT